MSLKDSLALHLARVARTAGDANSRTKALVVFIETVGNMLSGSREPGSDRLLRALMPADGPSSILGGTRCVGALDAAFVNCAAAYSRQGDGSVPGSIAEVDTAPLVAALFALGEARQASGRSLIDALSGSISLARSVQVLRGDELGRPAPCPAQMAALATAGGCAIMLDVGESRMAGALSLALSLQPDTCPSGANAALAGLHFGSAARNGLLAALLAAENLDCGTLSTELLTGSFSDETTIRETTPQPSWEKLFESFEAQATHALRGENIAILFERLETIEYASNLASIGRMLRTGDTARTSDAFSRIDLASDQIAIETQWVP